MTIDFQCPHCQHPYRLKEELAGKRATCKNPSCRKVFTIPAPPRAEEIEQLAVSALVDDPPAAEAPESSSIAMNCNYCGHQWQEPLSKAGKNVLCPECRQRLRVPEPQGKAAADWRQARTRLPSLARQNQEKLDGVVDASEAQLVSGQALAQAGVTEVELEPRPLREKLLIAGLILAVLGSIAGGVFYFLHRRQVQQDEHLMAQVLTHWQEGVQDLREPEAALGKGLLHLILAEEALRWDRTDKFKEAHQHLQKARNELRNAPVCGVRHALAAECALLTLRFGGDESQVSAQIRFGWLPDGPTRGGPLRGERSRSVHEELRLALTLLQGAEYDLRLGYTRLLADQLLDKDQVELALESLPLLLFSDTERNEVRAWLALEAHRRNKGSDLVARISRELLPPPPAGGKDKAPPPSSASPSALVLGQVLSVEKAPPLPPLPAQGPVPENLRLAHVLHLCLRGEPSTALAVAHRPGPVETQLKALLLGMETCRHPTPSQMSDWVEAASTLVANQKGKVNVRFADGQLLRCCQLAAACNRPEAARNFAGAIRDEGLREWAYAECFRWQLPHLQQRLAEESHPIPADLNKLCAAHLWGRFWIARHNTRCSGDLQQEQRAILGWSPKAVYAFGLAGIALGLHDR
ncbi:MAG: zinc-ribbon domain-containing protein [Gemmataceae bacterium]|nr:zinc-ribbon domain-containing protein [Gemmataceae bacterium]